ncbi:MAG: FkbM family methyltransferase [Candidatus Bathyarchaeia archaeon]
MKSLTSTLRFMGLSAMFKEMLRRVFGIKYRYNNVLVSSEAIFRILREIKFKGYNLYGSGNEVVVQTSFGEVAVDVKDIDLLSVLIVDPLEEMYTCTNLRDAVVIDVGAYIGETALLFLSKGAKRVYAFEPVNRHFHYLIRNIARNNAEGKIIPSNCGVWFRNTTIHVDYSGIGTGLRMDGERQIALKVKGLGDVLKTIFNEEGRIDLVKMDCEGCEYSLLKLEKEIVKLSKQYVIEVHGPESPIIDKMSVCGYRVKFVKRINQWITLYLFNS